MTTATQLPSWLSRRITDATAKVLAEPAMAALVRVIETHGEFDGDPVAHYASDLVTPYMTAAIRAIVSPGAVPGRERMDRADHVALGVFNARLSELHHDAAWWLYCALHGRSVVPASRPLDGVLAWAREARQ
jgi:hypothetical protein